MSTVVVSVAEAEKELPELLARVAAGEKVVIADAGRWVASLAPPPPMPPTAEEVAAQEERAKEAIRQTVRWQVEAGHLPPPDSNLWELFPTAERETLTRAATAAGVPPFTP